MILKNTVNHPTARGPGANFKENSCTICIELFNHPWIINGVKSLSKDNISSVSRSQRIFFTQGTTVKIDSLWWCHIKKVELTIGVSNCSCHFTVNCRHPMQWDKMATKIRNQLFNLQAVTTNNRFFKGIDNQQVGPFLLL